MKDGRIYFTEVNPRFQGSSALSAEIAGELGVPDLLLEHLAASLGLEPATGSGARLAQLLAAHGLERAHGDLDKLHLLKVEEIAAALGDLLKERFEVEPLQVSGSTVEWMSDLFWHVIVSGAGVPPSEGELSFYLNLTNQPYTARRFTRTHPGEYRPPPDDDGTTLRTDLGPLLCAYDCGLEAGERDWGRPGSREAFALAMAASLVEVWREDEGHRLAIALVSDYDLMLERAVSEVLPEGRIFHVVAPFVEKATQGGGNQAFHWLFGTPRVGEDDSLQRPQWQWLDEVRWSKRRSDPVGPILIRLTGSPLLDSGTLRELGLKPKMKPRMKSSDELAATAVFTEHDSVGAIMALIQHAPAGNNGGGRRLIDQLFGIRGLTWSKRSWLFSGTASATGCRGCSCW